MVFNRNGKALTEKNVRENDFYPWVEKLGLPKIRVHDLRHLHATLLLAGGVDLVAVSSRLGHALKAFTLQTYAHVVATAQEKAARVANEVLAGRLH
jgi:integrase